MTWRRFSAKWSWWKSLSQRHKTLFSIQKGCIESLMHTLKWLLSLHAFALKGAMSFLHLFSILQLHQCNTCWWNFRCTKATDTLEMPFWGDKIQEASLFFSSKTSVATPMLPYCVPSFCSSLFRTGALIVAPVSTQNRLHFILNLIAFWFWNAGICCSWHQTNSCE